MNFRQSKARENLSRPWQYSPGIEVLSLDSLDEGPHFLVIVVGPLAQCREIAVCEEVSNIRSSLLPYREKRALHGMQVLQLRAQRGIVVLRQRSNAFPYGGVRPFHVPEEITKDLENLHATARVED